MVNFEEKSINIDPKLTKILDINRDYDLLQARDSETGYGGNGKDPLFTDMNNLIQMFELKEDSNKSSSLASQVSSVLPQAHHHHRQNHSQLDS